MKTLKGLRVTLYIFLITILILFIIFYLFPTARLLKYTKLNKIAVEPYLLYLERVEYFILFFGASLLFWGTFLIFTLIALFNPKGLFKRYSSECSFKTAIICLIFCSLIIKVLIINFVKPYIYINPDKYISQFVNWSIYSEPNYLPTIVLFIICVIFTTLEIFFNRILKLVKIDDSEIDYYTNNTRPTTKNELEHVNTNQFNKTIKKVTLSNNELQNIEFILKYKELLDNGIITQEEFEDKKKSLL